MPSVLLACAPAATAAAAGMASPARAAAAVSSVAAAAAGGGSAARRRLFAVSTPGLERSLERELQMLRVPGRLEVVPGGVSIDGSVESLWRVALQSRVAESVRVRIGEPFHAPDARSLAQGLGRLPWQDCVDTNAAAFDSAPIVKAGSVLSRLYHVGLLEGAVREALGAALRRPGGGGTAAPMEEAFATPSTSSTDTGERPAKQIEEEVAAADGSGKVVGQAVTRKYKEPLDVRLQVKHDGCQVSALATGLLHRRGYRKAVGQAPLRETLASACVLASPLLRRLALAEHADEELVLWDPFCGSGTLLLEALGIVLGLHPGASKARSFPFLDFPSHDAPAYEEWLAELKIDPHPAASRLRLLGSDLSVAQVESARRNLRRFLRRSQGIPTIGDDGSRAAGRGGAEDAEAEEELPELPCTVSFEQGSPARAVQVLAGRPTMLLTNVPYGVMSGTPTVARKAGDRRFQGREAKQEGAADAYAQLGRLLRQHKADWRGVYCIAADEDELRLHTALDWTSELKFLNGSRWVHLLQWTGNAVSKGPSTSAPVPRSSLGGRRR